MTHDDLSASAVPTGGESIAARRGGGGPRTGRENSRQGDYGASGLGPTQNVSDAERWASAGAGGFLTVLGLLRGRMSGLVAAGAGAALLYRGLTGHCHCYEALGINNAGRKPTTAVPAQRGFKIEQTLTVRRSPEDLYGFWRDVENLPQVMRHLKRVDAIDARRSHWVAEGPLGSHIEWDAEVFNERGGEMIAWRSLPGGDVDTAGSIHFEPLGDQRSTKVTVSLKYNPPAGKVGAQLADFLGSGAEQQIAEDLRHFKRVMESAHQDTPAPAGDSLPNTRPNEPT